MPNLVYFEIGADNIEAAATFYSKVFDWKIEKAEDGSDYWYISTGDNEDDDPGVPGGLAARQDQLNPTVNTIEVKSIDHCARKIAENGGKVLSPKIVISGVGHLQYCHDPEGNRFGIMEYYQSDE
jgi:predicted enzyme related to lactoylglutathione lyase